MPKNTIAVSLLTLLILVLGGCGSSDESETPVYAESEAGSGEASSEDTVSLLIEGEAPAIISGPHQFTEGPYWHPDGFLLFSDIPANRVYRWSEADSTGIFLEPSGNTNGIQADTDGTLLLAQHRGSLGRLSEAGRPFEIFLDNFDGKRFNSPNDLTVHSNGTIFFTDPTFGVRDEDRELDFSGIYIITPDGTPYVFYTAFDYPNGIVLNAEENRLFVNDSGAGNILFFELDNDAIPHSPQFFANVGEMGSGLGAADGMITDVHGNLYTTGPRGLIIFDADGQMLHRIPFGEQITNLEWGGEEHDILFITGADHVFKWRMNTRGTKKR
ncbi:MAG: SMP-30/gluconolactonase/LRE family protein [Balneolales bacterium]|nr:SMP-30/gluconolactonase/LRE family protein [Balneolales bacterium]